MATRRPHRKSRLGCVMCKKRRVKCDEDGPPCGPCKGRSLACEYGVDARRARRERTDVSDKAYVNATKSIISTDWAASRRLLELELLHQWSTVTYKSYCGTVVDEYDNWSLLVPRLALQHECLLQGMMAMSALEIAAFSQDYDEICNHYVDVALELHNLASCGLRSELSRVTADNRQALFALSSILLVLGLALPRFASRRGEQGNFLDHIMTFLALLKGLRLIVDSKENFRQTEPLLANYRTWDSLPVTKLEPDVQHALQDLAALNEEMYGSGHTKAEMPEDKAIAYHGANRRALFYLRSEFEKCRHPDTRGYALGWPLRAGAEYMAAIADEEPVALTIFMAWGVLTEQISYGIWWMENVGRQMVIDLSAMVDLSLNQKLGDAVGWARMQVEPVMSDDFKACLEFLEL